MEYSNVRVAPTVRGGMWRQGPSGLLRWCLRAGWLYLAVLGAESVADHAVLWAQSQASAPGRLTVRPQEMATGTLNVKAGEQTLDSIPDYLVYVCKQCVGARRVPLVVILHGGGGNAREQMDFMREFADKYGMIMLLPNSASPGYWDIIANAIGSGDGAYPDVNNIDAAMKQVLQKYAIDPDKIAIGGMSNGGGYALFLGSRNLDVFSLVAPLTPASGSYDDATGPRNSKTQFFVSAGIGESSGAVGSMLDIAQQLRQNGHPVKIVLDLRVHEQRSKDYDHMWKWFHDSWAALNTAEPAASAALVDSVTVLTPEALTAMTALWTTLKAEVDSLLASGRTANEKSVTVSVGQERVTVFDMVDVPAIAAQRTSITAALAKAGLTTGQEEAYRAALIGARATVLNESVISAVAASSVLGKNVAFIQAHQAEVNALLDLMRVPRCENTLQADFGC